MKVLIVRVGAMGDVLHALPAVNALGPAQPHWQIDWVVDRRWASLLVDEQGQSPVVNRLHLVDTRAWHAAPFSRATLRSMLDLRLVLAEPGYDLAVDLQGTLRSAVIARLSRAPLVAGFADPRESLAKAFYTQTFVRRGQHVVEQNAVLLGDATGAKLFLRGAELPMEADAEAWAENMTTGAPTAVLAPSAGWGAKQWPAERFGALARALAADGYDVLVNATGAADTVAAEVVAASGSSARAVPCTIAQLTALLRRTKLFVGGDSGPTHLAAALGTPLVALYGPTDPARNGPWSEPLQRQPMRVLRSPLSVTSHKRVADVDRGLAALTVDEVLAAARALRSETIS